MNVYTPGSKERVAQQVHQLMMTIDPKWEWQITSLEAGGQAMTKVTVQMVQAHLERTWIQLLAPVRKMRAEEAENYATGLTESGGIACAISTDNGQHEMAVYVRVGTL